MLAVDGDQPVSKRRVPGTAQAKLKFNISTRTLRLLEPLTEDERYAWNQANPWPEFASALEKLIEISNFPEPIAMPDCPDDEIPLSRLEVLLVSLLPLPHILLPKTSHGHTRQYFPIHNAGRVEPSGVPVFDTFAVVDSDTPLVFHWPTVTLFREDDDDLREQDFIRILNRMTYFGRAESWCQATYSGDLPEGLLLDETHWRCVPIDATPLIATAAESVAETGQCILERKLCAPEKLDANLHELFLRFVPALVRNGNQQGELLNAVREGSAASLLIRCLLRESGEDIAAKLDRPIGTRWVRYAVPRAIYDLPAPQPKPRFRRTEMVQLVCYALNTATTHRPVLPPLTDTLLVADKFRAASLAIHEKVVDPGDQHHPRNLCGREENGDLCRDHSHAFFWPTDEDNDGFIDHVTVFCHGGFEPNEVDALRRLLRIRQRGGRPDLLVTPVFLGRLDEFAPWRGQERVFVSATPYFCPVHLSRGDGKSSSGKSRGGQVRPVTAEIIKALRQQRLIETESEVEIIEELVFDFAPEELAVVQQAIVAGQVVEPVPPRQYFPVIDPPVEFPPLPKSDDFRDRRYPKAHLKNPDLGYPFGQAVGLFVDQRMRFIRALSFCRRRRKVEIQGPGRMFLIVFRQPRNARPFAIGAQCHFGLGLFRPLELESLSDPL